VKDYKQYGYPADGVELRDLPRQRVEAVVQRGFHTASVGNGDVLVQLVCGKPDESASWTIKRAGDKDLPTGTISQWSDE
jgi:hypothetical protein